MRRDALLPASIAVLGAALLNLLLFALMQQLVRSDWQAGRPAATDYGTIRWVDWIVPSSPPPAPTEAPPPRVEPEPEPPPPLPAPPEPASPAPPRVSPAAAAAPAPSAPRLPSLDSLLAQLPNQLPLATRPSAPPAPPPPAVLDNPVPRLRVPPSYPPMARRLGVSGEVVVAFTITRDGRVRDARVESARPARLFDAAALRAIRAWEFEPPTHAGRPIEQPARQRFEFRLSD